MGFYERRIFPWLNEILSRDPELGKLRAEALASARGQVIEIGFGSGLNLPHYPESVDSITGIEPNEGMSKRAARRIAASRIPVEIVIGRAESLPLPNRAFDTAVSTLTLCTVSDVRRALSELRRVLRQDGRLLILEHGLAEDANIARWQNRLNRFQRIVGCGCNLNRPISTLIEDAGFRFESIRKFFAQKIPRPQGWVTLGIAR